MGVRKTRVGEGGEVGGPHPPVRLDPVAGSLNLVAAAVKRQRRETELRGKLPEEIGRAHV